LEPRRIKSMTKNWHLLLP